jgi:hypothetical protein
MPILTRRFVWPVWVMLAALLTTAAEPQTRQTREYDLKAVFLFNFIRFVQWPPGVLPVAGEPFVIGVLGDDPFGTSLDEVTANELIEGHEIVVQRYRDIREITTCHVLFISQSETPRLDSIFRALRGKSILTVGESERFEGRDGIIRFLVVQNKVRLKINVAAAREAKLTISSKLLRQAETTGLTDE